MGYCLEPLNDPSALEDRVAAFLEDRSSETITGPRRFGRTQLVEFVRDTAVGMGMSVWTTLFHADGPDLILLDHWSEMPDAERAMSENPDADVLFGQDLCHQVPAVVRHRRRGPRSHIY